MQATKRLAFFLVLLAFLGNLALGISLPVFNGHSNRAVKENNKQLHLSNKVKASAYFVNLEETEVVEESEADPDFDSTLSLQNLHIVYSAFLAQFFPQIYAAPQMANKPGSFRKWLWGKQEIFIHYQVFRI